MPAPVSIEKHKQAIKTERTAYLIGFFVGLSSLVWTCFLQYGDDGEIYWSGFFSVLIMLFAYLVGMILHEKHKLRKIEDMYANGVKLRGYAKIVSSSRGITSSYFSESPDMKNTYKLIGYSGISNNVVVKCTVLVSGKYSCVYQI